MANYYAYDSDSNVSTATTASISTNYSDISYDDFSYDVLNVSVNLDNEYKLLIPELYNKYIHGRTIDSDPNINGQFMVLQTFNYNNSNENKIIELFNYTNRISKFYKKYYLRNFRGLNHDLIKNYKYIMTNKSFLNVEIGKVYYLKGDECVCVIKTFWLKLIQRAWKKIYQQRKFIHQKRSNPTSLLYRQITAKWPDNCNYMPSIRGMLL